MDKHLRFLEDFFTKEEISRVEESKLKTKTLASDPYPLVYVLGMDFPKVHAYGKTLVDEEGYMIGVTPSSVAAAIVYTIQLIAEAKEESDIESFFYGMHDKDLAAHLLLDQGSTCLTLDKCKFYAERHLDLFEGSLSDKCVEDAARLLVKSPHVNVQRVGTDTLLFSDRKLLNEEREIAALIKERLARKSLVKADDRRIFEEIEKSEAGSEVLLSQEQTLACKMVLKNRLSILTGGPGTGKTQTQKVAIDAFLSLSPSSNIVCIAPTGQAAKRMTEVTGYKARTLHSFLKLAPGEMYPSDGPKLAKNSLVIADECSMMDTELCLSLLRSLHEDSHLLIVGDVAQLPSIGKGSILRELIKSEKVPVSRLTKIFRQKDNSIAFNSAKIHAGNPMLEYDKMTIFEQAKGSDNIAKAVARIYKNESAKGSSPICLTPLRINTETGVNSLNERLRAETRGCKDKYVKTSDGIKIYEGDKIVFLKNKYGLVNGEIGKALCCGPALSCSFGGKIIDLSQEDFDLVLPAYAQTVHKSQGSEYEAGIIVCDPAHKRMLSKEIIYTAVTRCKSRLYIVGDRKMLEETITGTDLERSSGLSAFLNVIC